MPVEVGFLSFLQKLSNFTQWLVFRWIAHNKVILIIRYSQVCDLKFPCLCASYPIASRASLSASVSFIILDGRYFFLMLQGHHGQTWFSPSWQWPVFMEAKLGCTYVKHAAQIAGEVFFFFKGNNVWNSIWCCFRSMKTFIPDFDVLWCFTIEFAKNQKR